MYVHPKTESVEAITFDELVEYGRRSPEANIVNGMPWSFKFRGYPITHETDDCYLIPSNMAHRTVGGLGKFNRGEVLVHDESGYLATYTADEFAAKYDVPPVPPSPALQLFYQVCRDAGHQMGKSNIRWDHTKDAAIVLAIRYGLRFDLDDFVTLGKEGRFYPEERHYTLACGEERGTGNMSACLAIEKRWGRKPFLLREPGVKTPTRVHIGRRFRYAGEMVTVTSFAKDQSYFNVCSYGDDMPPYGEYVYFKGQCWRTVEVREPNPSINEGWGLRLEPGPIDDQASRKVKHRFKFNHETIRNIHAQMKEAEKALAVAQEEAAAR